MTTQQLLTKIREFATNNYCSCEGRIHDPENLMEQLLKECEKWEKKIDKNCQHDWAYDVPDLPRLRVCQLCGRKERREIIGISYGGLPDFSEWMPIIGDMDLDKTKKEAKKKMSANMTPVEIIDEMLRWAEEREQEKKKLEERERKAKERKENATKQKPMKLKEKIAIMEAAAKVADFWEVDAADLVSWVAIKRQDKIAEWNEIANEVSSFYESMLSELKEIRKEKQKNKEAREK